ncbi:hypothetical protein D0469_02270 [Peribacillus saganii]|uniref:Uncharacterized protein n=1 Tax=Peribacillus saganii TaxID=2303992 RepID=A0A372LTY2_9BACI|nr:hypothetical protein D0469_02270 [Peribacillus saganii]
MADAILAEKAPFRGNSNFLNENKLILKTPFFCIWLGGKLDFVLEEKRIFKVNQHLKKTNECSFFCLANGIKRYIVVIEVLR